MVFVEGGTFTMGATAEQGSDAYDREKPTHSVTLSDYYIGKYEVTQAQWIAVMGTNPSTFIGDNNPVDNVSWDDVQEFIIKLNEKTGKMFRLPTEAEWEYAARGGNQSKGYKYSGSDNIDEVAWYEDNSNSKTHPVGQKAPNELGIYDMSGNVCERCGDWYGSYSSSSQTNPTGPSSGSSRVLRGGIWFGIARYCRVSYRSYSYPVSRDFTCGFRLVLEAEGSESPEPEPEPEPISVVAYSENCGTSVEKSNGYWPYVDQFTGWARVSGNGYDQSAVSYTGVNASVRNSGAEWAPLGVTYASDAPYVYLQAKDETKFVINNIALKSSVNSYTLSFTAFNQYAGLIASPYTPVTTPLISGENLTLYLSVDGQRWGVVNFTATTSGNWELVTAPFTLPAATDKLFVKFANYKGENTTALPNSSYQYLSTLRIDDFCLVEGGNGPTIDFTLTDDEGGSAEPEPASIPNNEIWYTSTDGNVVNPYATDVFGASIESITYSDGKGIIKFSGNVTSIGIDAFRKCNNLKSITIPVSVTSIGGYAFRYCSSLTSVTIGNGVTSIGSYAFDDCSRLTSITIPNKVTKIGEYAFRDCSELTSITIPNSVTEIGRRAFYICSSLTSITIPDSVTSIGNAAFGNCSSLVEFNGKFASSDKRCLIVDGVLNSFAPYGLTKYTIPDSVTSIGDWAFSNCSSLTSITITDSVTSIESGAFNYCSSLTSITIPNSVTSIGVSAFYSCSSLTSITIPDSVTSIEYGAFNYCSSLAEFNGKFASADKRCLIVNGGLHSFAPYGLTKYTIPDSVTEIGSFAFYECSSLTSITIPNSVTEIGSFAFDSCNSLTSITIPNSVTSIGLSAFNSCSSLKSVYCKPTTPPTLGESDVFDLNASDRKIYVPSSSVSAYKSAQYWSEYADAIVADPSEPDISSLFSDDTMVYVQGGTFTMGATAEQGSDADGREKPTHSVTLSDYYIGKYEVTQAQWTAVMGSNPSNFTGDNNPVDYVSWDEVQEFITKLNAQTGKRFRLPAEAEWEYAARGGSQSKGYKYSGSDSIDEVAWCHDNSSSTTHPVGQKTPNELGIYDMSGNVWEWCGDWYGSYSSEAQTNPMGPSSGSSRVLRGGSWNYFARNCRVSYRFHGTPDYRFNGSGFRLAMDK